VNNDDQSSAEKAVATGPDTPVRADDQAVAASSSGSSSKNDDESDAGCDSPRAIATDGSEQTQADAEVDDLLQESVVLIQIYHPTFDF
jgi:hypothetical protein